MKTLLHTAFIIFFLITTNHFVYSQGKCGTVAPGAEWENWFQQSIAEYKIQQASRSGTSAVVTIPVILHILHNNKAVGTSENIAAAQVKADYNARSNPEGSTAQLGNNTQKSNLLTFF